MLEGLDGAQTGAGGAVPQDGVDLLGVGFEGAAASLDGGDLLDDRVGEPALALDAADAGGAAALARLRSGPLRSEKTLCRSKTGQTSGLPTSVRRMRAGSVTMVLSFARRSASGSSEQDGVAVALGHLAAVEAGQLGRWRQQHFRLGQNAIGDGSEQRVQR